MPQFHDDTGTVHQRRVEQRLSHGNVLTTALSEFDNIGFEFLVGLPNASRLHRFELAVVSKNWDVGSVEGNVLNVDVVHQNVHFTVADKVPSKIIEEFGLGFFVDFHAVGFDDLVHGRSDISFWIGINFFDVCGQRPDENIHDFIALFLFFLGQRWFDDLVDDVQRLLVANDAGKGMRRHDWVLVQFIVLRSLSSSLPSAATAFFSCHGHQRPRLHSATTPPRL